MGELNAEITDDGVHNVALKKSRSNFRVKVFSRQSTGLHFGGIVSIALLACRGIVNKRCGCGRIVRIDHWTSFTQCIFLST